MMPDGKSALMAVLEHPLTWLFGSGGAGALLGQYAEKKKRNAEAESTLSNATLAIVKDLREQLSDALKRLGKVEEQNRLLLSHVFKLRNDNFTLRNYIAIMTRRAGDPVVPPLLMDNEEDPSDDPLEEERA